MCGRYVAASPTDVLADEFGVDEVVLEADRASYNVAPTDPVPAVAVRSNGLRRLGQFRWGLVPSWSKDASGAARLINARAETVLTKPAFRTAMTRRRCIIPADGFFEWERRADGSRQPWYVRRADGHPMAFAGLWEVWGPEGGPLLRSCTIITTSANAIVSGIHDRMPVILPRDRWDGWLDRTYGDEDELATWLVPAPDDDIVRHPVSRRVGDVRNNDASLIAAVPHPGPVPVPLELL